MSNESPEDQTPEEQESATPEFATGGIVNGPVQFEFDNTHYIPAYLMNGEGVISAANIRVGSISAKKIYPSVLETDQVTEITLDEEDDSNG